MPHMLHLLLSVFVFLPQPLTIPLVLVEFAHLLSKPKLDENHGNGGGHGGSGSGSGSGSSLRRHLTPVTKTEVQL